MTREDTRTSSQTTSLKQSQKSATFYQFASILGIASLLTGSYFVVFTEDSLGDPSDQFVVKTIPKFYTRLEGLDPEERDVFHGFQTSFLPMEEGMLAKKNSISKRQFQDDDSLSFIWKDEDFKPRVKRTRPFEVTTTEEYESGKKLHRKVREEASESDEDENISEIEKDYEGSDENNSNYDNEESIETMVRPEPHVDRGPLDDVVEQIRGQPELEEGEMGSSAHLYQIKPSQYYSGIHAFWKGQGDKNTIRNTQAAIMKQYMDTGADPCADFYQYACGNWATLNPIPADKAGYDTFEMLRENLDTVLKELLEFKPHESMQSSYPGPHLILDNNLLDFEYLRNVLLPIRNSDYIFESNRSNVDRAIINRIRRYLEKESKRIKVPITKNKHNFMKYHHGHYINNKFKNKFLVAQTKLPKFKSGYKYRPRINTQRRRKNVEIKYGRIGRQLKTVNHMRKKPEDLKKNDAAVKARYLFKSCMNYDILQKRGHQPLLDLLDILGGWPILDENWSDFRFDWLEQIAKLRLYNNDILISEWVGPDIKNSDEFVIQFDQTSLGLPTRDYFLQKTNKIYLDAYKHYLIKIALLLGGDREYVLKSADQLIDFEIRLAKITSTPEDRRNVSELYRRMPLKKLATVIPEVNWQLYLTIVMNRTISPDETVVLFALNYVRHLVVLINETESSTLSNYLLWRFVRHRVNNLDDRFQSAKQQFYFVLFGREQAPPRWKNCISQVNSNMGMALGSMFVRKYFDEMSKNDTLVMTREIQQSFRELLHTTDWIDDNTKKLAAHKVDAMMLRIGYPNFILNEKELNERYIEVNIHPDKYFENILNILLHLTKMEQSRIGQPVNKTLWNTAPAVVNAYYSRNKNQIMFPAGILQPPFYHRHFPRSLNYGGIGVVIGHEITHGFDDKGRLFDCNGNLHRWWSDEAIEVFHRRAQCLINQYGRYIVPEVNMKLDGVNTQGENIADNGGVKQAFHAYVHWVKRHGTAGETLPGLNHTHTQLFFLNFAQVWCGAMRPEAMRNKLKTAVHSPGRFRVIGTLSNSLDFAREFKCPVGSPMNPVHKCSVW